MGTTPHLHDAGCYDTRLFDRCKRLIKALLVARSEKNSSAKLALVNFLQRYLGVIRADS